MSPQARLHQARARDEARTLEAMQHVPPALRRAQAARVFRELKAMTGAESNVEQKQVRRPWWLDPER